MYSRYDIMGTCKSTSQYKRNPEADRRLIVKYTKEERLDIGRRIYTGELSRYEASEKYVISINTARDYMRLYRDAHDLPAKRGTPKNYAAGQTATSAASLEELESMSKEELIRELIKARINEARLKKRIRSEGRWYGNSVREREYEIILELSGEFPVKLLCEVMNIRRSSFYAWKKRLSNPSERAKNLIGNIMLFQEYHMRYPSHGYRWLNAKIRLDTGLVLSAAYAHKCCKIAGIKSEAKHYKYKKPGDPGRVFPNLFMTELRIDKPLQCIVSDMTSFSVKGVYYELTLYMDLWNNEIVSHALSSKRGDRMTYISGLQDLIERRKQYPEYRMILHSDQGSVYTSKAFNELLPAYVARSMSRAGTPTDNAAMEAINGWIKAELFMDFHVTGERSVKDEIDDYIAFFNEQRPAYSLNYLTPVQFRMS